jgi:EmrB/QacA subfamily drug resistance transporter
MSNISVRHSTETIMTVAQRGAVHDAASQNPPIPRRWTILALLSVAQAMLVVDVTVVNVALPSIGADLRLDRAALTWIVTAYTLFFGSLLLLGGRLADGLGRRRMFLAGIATFVGASLASGLAPDGMVLVAARAAQGVGAALMSPAALSIVTTTFAGPERTRALGVWAAIGGGGAALGVVLGGLLTSGPGWQWIFFVNVPVGIVVAAGVLRIVPSLGPTERARLDVAGAVVATIMFGALIMGLIAAGDAGWTAPATLAPLGVALTAAIAFVAIERVVGSPLVRLERLIEPPLAAGLAVLVAAAGLLAGAFFLNSLYIQHVLGQTALATGVAFIPVALAIVVGAQAAAHGIGRVGARPTAALGFIVAAAGMLLMARVPVGGDLLVDVLPGFVLGAVGLGSLFVVGTTTSFAAIEHEDAGLVSGLVNTGHELGFALGVALVSTIAAASVGTEAVSIGGFRDAFLAAAVFAIVAAVGALRFLPAGRLATEGHAFAH